MGGKRERERGEIWERIEKKILERGKREKEVERDENKDR